MHWYNSMVMFSLTPMCTVCDVLQLVDIANWELYGDVLSAVVYCT